MTPLDVAFGRIAQARQLVAPDALRAVAAQLPPGTPLATALVQRGLLAPTAAQALLAELAGETADDSPTVAGGALAAPDPVAEAPTVAGGGPAPVGAGGLPEPGDVIAERFELRAVLGKGGMGAVFRARDRVSGEEVALKVLLADAAPDARSLARFQREAEAVARVDSHPGIVRIRAAGLHAGRQPWAAMDLIAGRDLKGLLKELGPRPVEVALELAEQIARAVQHCHERGIVHRDLKPANVLVRDEDLRPMVTDFGLALDAAAERLTRSGEVLGTPAYMPPEQAGGSRSLVDARSDVYALGAILFELLAARPPFVGDGLHGVLKKVLLDPPPRPTALRPELPPDIDAIVLKALAKERLSRYPTAAAFADDCARLRRGEPIQARAPSGLELLRWRLGRRDPRAVGPLALLALLVAGAALLALDQRPPAPTELLRERLAALEPALDAGDPVVLDATVAALVTDLLACLPAELPARLMDPLGRPAALRPLARLEALAALRADDPDPALAALAREAAGREAALARLALRVAVQGGAWPRRPPPPGPETELLEALHALGWAADVAPARSDGAPLRPDGLARAAAAEGPVGAAARRTAAALDRLDAEAAEVVARDAARLEARMRDALAGSLPRFEWAAAPAAGPLRAYRAEALRRARARALGPLSARLLALAAAGEGRDPRRAQGALRALVQGLLLPPGEPPGPEGLAAAAGVLRHVLDQCARLGPEPQRRALVELCPLLDACVDAVDGEQASDLAVAAMEVLLLAAQAWTLGQEIPPPEVVLTFVRLGFLPTSYVGADLLRREVKRGTFVRWAEEKRTGDAWLLCAEAMGELEFDAPLAGDLALAGAASEVERTRQALELGVRYRALAHGEGLSPDLRRRLALGPAEPLERPLCRTWEAQSLGDLLVGIGFLEGQRASPSQGVLDACLAELERVRASARFPDLFRRVKFLSAAGRFALGCRQLQRFDPAWREACLERGIRWHGEAFEAGAALVERATEGARSAREGSVAGLSRDGDPVRARRVGLSRPARDLGTALLDARRPAQARAALERGARLLLAAGDELEAAAVEYWVAVCALAQGQADEAEAIARRHVELGRRQRREGLSRRQLDELAGLTSGGRALACQAALARGDLAAARAELDALADELPDHDPARDWRWGAPLRALPPR